MAVAAIALILGSLIVLVAANRSLFERLVLPLLHQQDQFWRRRTGLKPQNQRLTRCWLFAFGVLLVILGAISVAAVV